MFNNAEAAFQLSKTGEPFPEFCTMDAPDARVFGRKAKLRPDWEEVKEGIMKDILRVKFTMNDDLRNDLLATEGMYLIEGNRHHDNYWGACTCNSCIFKDKKNRLGELLMEVREELLRDREVRMDDGR